MKKVAVHTANPTPEMFQAQRPNGTTYFFHAKNPEDAKQFVQPGDTLMPPSAANAPFQQQATEEASADPFNSPQQPAPGGVAQNQERVLLVQATNKTAAPGQKTPTKGEFYAEKDGDDWSVFHTETDKCYATYSEKPSAEREAKRLNENQSHKKKAGDMNAHDDSGLPEKLEQEVTSSPNLGLVGQENKVGKKMNSLGTHIAALAALHTEAADKTAALPVEIQAANAVGDVLQRNKIPVSHDLLGEIANSVEEYVNAWDAHNPGVAENEF